MHVVGYRSSARVWHLVGAIVVGAVVLACGGTGAPTGSAGTVENLQVEIVGRRPHAPLSYTEGLVMADGRLYESSGLYDKSALFEVQSSDGAHLRSQALDRGYFGEGVAVVDDRLIQLTWQEHTAIVYQLSDFSPIGTFTYPGEGWGLCDDGARLVMSNGSSALQFRDRSTFDLLGTVNVTNAGAPQEDLNELECVDGSVYANVNESATIVRLDPSSGLVTATIDASAIFSEAAAAGGGVMNGIAYDNASGTYLLTGKYWPTMYEARFVPDGR
jgi:glutaminyl-peptide cyclotransferase